MRRGEKRGRGRKWEVEDGLSVVSILGYRSRSRYNGALRLVFGLVDWADAEGGSQVGKESGGHSG